MTKHTPTAQASFTTDGAATHFLRGVRPLLPKGSLSGFMAASGDWRVNKANAIAAKCAPQRVASLMRGYRGTKGVSFTGVRCECCGTLLTNPESVAAGRGPRCMEA